MLLPISEQQVKSRIKHGDCHGNLQQIKEVVGHGYLDFISFKISERSSGLRLSSSIKEATALEKELSKYSFMTSFINAIGPFIVTFGQLLILTYKI